MSDISVVQTWAAAGGGLLLSMTLRSRARIDAGTPQPSTFMRIDRRGEVTLILANVRRRRSALAPLVRAVAEELRVAATQVHVEEPLLGPGRQARRPANTSAPIPLHSIRTPLREMAATAHSLLVRAAARHWKVDAARLKASNGLVQDGTGRRKAHYGSLADLAATLRERH